MRVADGSGIGEHTQEGRCGSLASIAARITSAVRRNVPVWPRIADTLVLSDPTDRRATGAFTPAGAGKFARWRLSRGRTTRPRSNPDPEEPSKRRDDGVHSRRGRGPGADHRVLLKRPMGPEGGAPARGAGGRLHRERRSRRGSGRRNLETARTWRESSPPAPTALVPSESRLKRRPSVSRSCTTVAGPSTGSSRGFSVRRTRSAPAARARRWSI